MRKESIKKKRKPVVRYVLLSLLAILVAVTLVFTTYGGFSTGECADVDEFKTYAGTVSDIEIPDGTSIVALGEATHGNVEFQQLRLEVFKHLVESDGIKAFALEGDFGGCEQVNRYIHGGDGSAEQAAAAIDFAIYRTEQTEQLIEYMREYNQNAAEGEDLRFYGFDVQRCAASVEFLGEQCDLLGIDSAKLSKLSKLVDGKAWSEEFDTEKRIEIITEVKTQLESKENNAFALQLAEVLLQNCRLNEALTGDSVESGIDLRDRIMADNIEWISAREQSLGHACIFVSAHVSHVARYSSYDSMGSLLADENNYYAIGTDFYKTNCNLPVGRQGKRANHSFYSHDPLAKASYKAGFDVSYLDFATLPADSKLYATATDYTYLGHLGESYSIINELLPPSYRMFQPPATLYDGMIFVSSATPTKIK